MRQIAQFMTEDHNHCDDLFVEAENAVADQDWPMALETFQRFAHATLRHFTWEEEILFPAFETQAGMAGGPTYIMRSEHDQMRDALAAMEQALTARDASRFLGMSETLLMLMRQHNMKEEGILYPMMDQALGRQSEQLLDEMKSSPLADVR